MIYRTHYDVLAGMLSNCINPITKTKLMYSSFLSHSQLKSYTNELVELGLATENNGQYTITVKGKEYLDLYNKLKIFVQPKEETKPTRARY